MGKNNIAGSKEVRKMSQKAGLIIYVNLMVTKREEKSNSAEEDSEPRVKSPMDEKE